MNFGKRGGVFKNLFKKKTGARLPDFFCFEYSCKKRCINNIRLDIIDY